MIQPKYFEMVSANLNCWNGALLALEESEIHIWQLRPALLQPILDDCLKILSDSEIRQAGQMSAERRLSFVSSRYVLRSLLDFYCPEFQRKSEIPQNKDGKPHLPSGTIYFNISHSGELALVAITRKGPVGLDVEKLRDGIDMEKMARRIFSGTELSEFQKSPDNGTFFRLWVNKEAWVKAHGKSLFAANSIALEPFEKFEFIPSPGYLGAGVVLEKPPQGTVNL